ncbi:MAG: hypothetical protein CUR34_02055 [Sediminibacterium sp.]|nr:MAG: hypothetical protein CUR34_02055 [Sediminibacterium sp.] [Sediminibacterium sp. FEMGT703S]
MNPPSLQNNTTPNTFKRQLNILLFTAFLLLTTAFSSSAQVTVLVSAKATSNGNTIVDSIKTGKNFIYVIDYSVSSLVTNATGLVLTVPLPQNLTVASGSTSIAFDNSQINSVSNVGGVVTATFKSPLAAGSAGQMQISLVYTNGSTPNGYTPDLIATFTGTNVNAPSKDTTTVKALAANNIVLNKVRRNFSTNPTINSPFTYDLSYTNSGGAEGNLNLYNATITDTLDAGVVFVSATNFGSITPTVTSIAGGKTVVSWNWGATAFTGSGSASITVRYTSPTFSVGSVVGNCASLRGQIPVLPFIGNSATLADAPELRACANNNTLIANTVSITNGGSGIGSNIPGMCPGTVMAGSTANFTTKWTNAGNTTLDSVVVVTNIDPNIDVTSVFARRVTNPIPGSTSPDLKVFQFYELNTAPGVWVAVAGSPFQNTSMNNSYPVTLTPGQYITRVKIKVEPDSDEIGPYFSQDLTYTGTIRTALQGPNGGGTIIQGSNNPSTCTVTTAGTQVKNCYTLTASANGAPISANPGCGNTNIVGPVPVFSSLNKTTKNGTSFGPTQEVEYEISGRQLGIGIATNVTISDTLDARLTYIPNSAEFKLNSGAYAPIAPANVSVNGQTLVFALDPVSSGSQVFVKFRAAIVDGTSPSTIANQAIFASPNSIINAGSGSSNPKTNRPSITVITAAAYTSKLGQTGCDTSKLVYYPENAEATPQGKVKYRAVLKNSGNVGAKDITIINVFPFIGDTRGSEYFAHLAAPVSFSDPSTTVYYTTVSNPCMPEFNPDINPAGCNTPSWTTIPPADITSVKAIKMTRSASIAPLDSLVYTWPMITPVGVPSNITMYNSYTYQLSRADNSAQLLPATPNKVGMITSCISALGSLGNYVWVDSNANGLQDESILAGLNGLKIYLYKPGPSNIIGGNDQILLDSTLTANDFNGRPGYYTFTNLNTGNYYVKFPILEDKVFTKMNQTSQTDNNSNATRSNGYSELVPINANGTGLNKDNPTIDAGYIVCTLNASFNKSDITCNGWSDGNTTLTVTGNRGPSGYLWNDGNTTKNRTFLTAGTYSVLIEDSVGCKKTLSNIVIVNPPTLAPIAGKNSICIDSTVQLSHPTPGGVWGVSNNAVATISNTGLLTGITAGSVTVTYKINNTSCGTALFYPFVSNCGPSGGVGGGNDGGVESKSLGDAIGNRIFSKSINSIATSLDYTKLPEIQINSSIQSQSTGTVISLNQLLPKQLASNAFKAVVTTPMDIISMTNAKEVLSIDFSIDNKAKAVAFGTRTEGQVYDHTKTTCDRLKGAELIAIQNVVVNGINMIRYDLKGIGGTIEYAMSFAVGYKNGRNSYSIQSNWLNQDYLSDDIMYNVQLWALNTGLLMDMASSTISKLQASMPVFSIESKAGLPKTFISYGKRDGVKLALKVANHQNAGNGYFIITEKSNENSTTTNKKTIPFSVVANGTSTIQLPVGDNYEAAIDLYFNGKLEDQVFMTDGSWGYDYNTATSSVKNFVISNDLKIANSTTDDYLLFRNMKIDASSPDYISVYKVLRGGGVPQDLSEFKAFKFNASGAGTNLRITLVKSSITNWSDQYSYIVPLSGENKSFNISLKDFKSKTFNTPLNPIDLSTAVFSFEVANSRSTSFTGTITGVSFTKEDLAYANSLLSKEVNVYPNPATRKFNVSFKSDIATDLVLKLTHSTTGKVILVKNITAVKGENIIPIELYDLKGTSIYVLSLEGSKEKYNSKKVIISEK